MVTNIIGLILVICIIFLVYDNYYLSKEDLSQYTRCHQKPLKGIMKQIFDKFNINPTMWISKREVQDGLIKENLILVNTLSPVVFRGSEV